MNKWLKTTPKAIKISLIVSCCLLFVSYLEGNPITWHRIKWNVFYSLLYSLTLYYANGLLFDLFDAIYKKNRFSGQRLVLGGFCSLALSIGIIFLLRLFEEVVIDKESVNYFLANEKASNYIISVVITIIVTLSLYSFRFYKALQDQLLKEQQIIASTAALQFENLKNQIDPHFLFNSLNVLSSLIEENPVQAQQFTTYLSNVYRYVLEQKDKDLIPLVEELTFTENYIKLLQMRFESGLIFDCSMAYNGEPKVVPLSLQILIENTIKHNIVSEQKPLCVKIYLTNEYVVVQNNLQRKSNRNTTTGIGQKNIISRYKLITNKEVLIEVSENFYTVYLPIID